MRASWNGTLPVHEHPAWLLRATFYPHVLSVLSPVPPLPPPPAASPHLLQLSLVTEKGFESSVTITAT